MEEYSNGPLFNENGEAIHVEKSPVSKITDSFLAKVYAYFGAGLIVTGLVAIGFSYLFNYLFSLSGGDAETFFIVTMVISAIVMSIMTIVLCSKSARGKGSLGLFLGYSVVWGVFLASLVYYVQDPTVLGLTFLVSAFLFLGMSVIGFFIKNKVAKILTSVAFVLVFGILGLCLINFIILPFTFFGSSNLLYTYIYIYWAVEVLYLIYIMILTVIDTYRMKKIAEAGGEAHNLVLYCAFTLYLDFIYTFIYVLRFVLMFVGRSKN